MSSNNKFVFIAPMYNASETLPRMLHSICGQSYENWELILIDDVSSEEHVKSARRTCTEFKSMFDGKYSEKITNIWNIEKKWEVANVLKEISLCNDDDIICRIDADDWLTDLDALAILDSAYIQTG